MQHKYLLPLLLILSFGISGCSNKVFTIERETSTDKFAKDGKYLVVANYGGDDVNMLELIKAVAQEGKSRGYEYFAVLMPGSLNNIHGSAITLPSELVAYCPENFLTDIRKGCIGLRSKSGNAIKVLLMHEKSEDFLVWSIDETLNDPIMLSVNGQYELVEGEEAERIFNIIGKNHLARSKVFVTLFE